MDKKIEDYLHLYKNAIYKGGKLVLRKLSDMTDDEKVKVYLWEYSNYKTGELVKNDSDSDSYVVKNEHGMKCYMNFQRFSPETTRKLLKQGFDLFGLIESGLAIDATTLKQNHG